MNSSDEKPIWREHLTLTLSACLTLLLSLKVLAVGNYQLETALGIVQVAGTSNILIAGLIAVLPVLTIWTAVYILTRWGHWARSRTGIEKLAVMSAVSIPSILILSIVPIVLIAALFVGFLLLRLVIYLNMRYERNHPDAKQSAEPTSTVETYASRAAAITSLLFLTVTTSWMPTESVSISGAKPVSAYTIGQRDGQTIILPTERGQRLIVADSADVKRNYCDTSSWLSVTVIQLFHKSDYPDCP